MPDFWLGAMLNCFKNKALSGNITQKDEVRSPLNPPRGLRMYDYLFSWYLSRIAWYKDTIFTDISTGFSVEISFKVHRVVTPPY